jgi:ribosomal-protein-alanine N-acetyltransferase
MITKDRMLYKNILLSRIGFDYVTEQYVKWMNDPEVTKFLGVRFSEMTELKIEQDLADALLNPNVHMFAINYVNWDDATVTHIGNIKLTVDPRHNKGVIGVVIGERDYWGLGAATAAITLLTDVYSFEFLGLHHVSAGMYGNNTAIQRAFSRAGYCFAYGVCYDKLFEGEYVDSLFYVKRRGG